MHPKAARVVGFFNLRSRSTSLILWLCYPYWRFQNAQVTGCFCNAFVKDRSVLVLFAKRWMKIIRYWLIWLLVRKDHQVLADRTTRRKDFHNASNQRVMALLACHTIPDDLYPKCCISPSKTHQLSSIKSETALQPYGSDAEHASENKRSEQTSCPPAKPKVSLCRQEIGVGR